MRTLLAMLPPTAALLLFHALSLSAQSSSFRSPEDSLGAADLVGRYMSFNDKTVLSLDTIDRYAAGEYARRIVEYQGDAIGLPGEKPRRLVDLRTVRDDGSLAMAVIAFQADSLPRFGPVTIDRVLFLRRDSSDALWRISAIRDLAGVPGQIDELHKLEASNYPESLKRVIARESSRLLLSNEQVRRDFREHRAGYMALAEQFRRSDSLLRSVARIDKVISQINNVGIVWGDAAEEIPRDAVDEYLSRLDKSQQKQFRDQLRAAEKQRRTGFDSLAQIAKRLRIPVARIDTLVTTMYDLGVSFVTNRLPWPGAVQITIAGAYDNAVGLLYSPSGEVPLISPDEYFYLEDLGEGWWIFRAT